jgi:hypothetical protein
VVGELADSGQHGAADVQEVGIYASLLLRERGLEYSAQYA